MFWTLIGSTAAILTTFAFIPQIIKAYTTKSIKDVSLVTLIQLSIGVSFWIAYGVHLNDCVIITANSVTLALLITLICQHFYYRKLCVKN
jgi:MtN3 and saliva related transmembrane protein